MMFYPKLKFGLELRPADELLHVILSVEPFLSQSSIPRLQATYPWKWINALKRQFQLPISKCCSCCSHRRTKQSFNQLYCKYTLNMLLMVEVVLNHCY